MKAGAVPLDTDAPQIIAEPRPRPSCTSPYVSRCVVVAMAPWLRCLPATSSSAADRVGRRGHGKDFGHATRSAEP